MRANQDTLLMEKLETLEGLEEKVKSMDTKDIMARTLLYQEAFEKIYTSAVQALMKGNPAIQEAARDSALVNTRVAQAFHESYGEPYENIAKIVAGGRVGNNTYNMPVTSGIDPNERVPVIDLTGKIPTTAIPVKNIKASLRAMVAQDPIMTGDKKALIQVINRKIDHLTFSSHQDWTDEEFLVRQGAISHLAELINGSTLIESGANTKINHNMKGKSEAQKRKQRSKNRVRTYHFFFVPVKVGQDIWTVRIVAEEENGTITVDPALVNAYDVILDKKDSSPTMDTSRRGSITSKDESLDTISVHEMLSGVNDMEGQPYFQLAG